MTGGHGVAGTRPPGTHFSVSVECEVRPSEDPSAVAAAISEILPGAPVRVEGGRAEAAADGPGCLSRIAETIRSRSSGAAYLRCMLRNIGPDGTWFYLNKQAAAAGRIALCAEADESPMGPVRVTLRSQRVEDAIDWLVPGKLDKAHAAREKAAAAARP